MKFVDSAAIRVEAGDGGDGCLSFRREKFIPYGGPDGGDGGDGGAIYLQGEKGLNTLSDFRHQRLFRAKNGQPGMGQNRRGKSADDLIISVPLGLKVFDLNTDELIGEVLSDKERLLVAKGGFHGLGNTRFKSSVNQAPRKTTQGSKGDIRDLAFELNVLADVGLLGMPNAGKSSLIRQVSSAKPKVADYPFTTLIPNLGVVTLADNSFIMADIPGIIKDASKGAGLGFKFLKHLSRTRVLLHIVDILPEDSSNPVDNYLMIEKELKKYSQELANKHKILVFNKLDLIPKHNIKKLCNSYKKAMGYKGKYFIISAINGMGIKKLINYLDKECLNKDG